jgi:hypothetical protein
MRTVGHHTCKKDGGRTYVKKEAPFLSTYDEATGSYPFLGTGYYMWDDNLELAKWWGDNQKERFATGYFVVRADLDLQAGIFLDLVGNRQHLEWFRGLMERLKKANYNIKHWTIAQFIEFAKRVHSADYQVFPFKVIRAVDHSPDSNPKSNFWSFFFVKKKKNYTNLDPRLVICLLEKNDVILQNKEVIVES